MSDPDKRPYSLFYEEFCEYLEKLPDDTGRLTYLQSIAEALDDDWRIYCELQSDQSRAPEIEMFVELPGIKEYFKHRREELEAEIFRLRPGRIQWKRSRASLLRLHKLLAAAGHIPTDETNPEFITQHFWTEVDIDDEVSIGFDVSPAQRKPYIWKTSIFGLVYVMYELTEAGIIAGLDQDLELVPAHFVHLDDGRTSPVRLKTVQLNWGQVKNEERRPKPMLVDLITDFVQSVPEHDSEQ